MDDSRTEYDGSIRITVADCNDINFHEWRDRLGNSPGSFSTSPAPSFISLSSTGSEQDLAHQFDIPRPPPSPDSLSAFATLNTTISTLSLENGGVDYSRLSHDRMISYSRPSNSPTTSPFGFPSPTPSNSSSHFSDSSWVDTTYLSADNTYHFNSSPELLPQSPLRVNNSSGYFSPYEETFPPGLFPDIPVSSEPIPPLSPLFSSSPSSEHLTGVSDPLIDDFISLTSNWDPISHPGPESPARQYLLLFRSLSQPEFAQGSSSQAIPRKAEAPDSYVNCKPQVTSEAALAMSEKKRKNPPICTCIICGRGFTRKHSHTSHMQAHLGQRTKLCDFCGNFFAGTLSRHKKTCKNNPNREPPKKKRS